MTAEEMVGHYRIVELLGSGAMGTVRVAVDTYIDRPVAIKSLRSELTNDPDFVSRFRAEAKSLARLSHPNIAALYTPIIAGSEMHLVMELVRGKALDAILRDRGRPLGVSESLAIMAQAADGLAYAHEMGVVHRDIKPGNLMVGSDGRVKIMDFGIARVQGSVRLTRTGTAVGTPLYMSPEQCRGGEGDERSDVYSLAVVLYELLSGAPPFSAETEYALIQAQITETPKPLVPRVAGVTPTLESEIMKALAKKPEQRHPSMRAFSDAIGATALRADATGVLRSATHLIEAQDEPGTAPASPTAIDVAMSRVLRASRGWSALSLPAKAGVVAGMLGLAAAGVFLAGDDSATARFGGKSFALGDLRSAIKGSAVESIRSADFSRVSDAAKAQLLAPARALADAGNAEAQFVLGMLLSETPGAIDRAGAFDAFRRAAEQNFADAQVNLGMLYQRGDAPGGRDTRKAAEWFTRAAQNGNGKGLFWLGCYYQYGWGGLPVDISKAVDNYGQSAAARYPRALDAMKAASGAGAASPCI